ncbi:MAG TPA: S9 family peptidase [Kofleriaceae bacterium]|jgi:dipeptidyl aminopeptidase/acylaminoacyl peptidase|nr:S9 family peptidase [Kofleriaceae bacterium]
MPTFDVDALTRLRRVGAIDVSPDGTWLAVAVTRLGDDDAYVSDLWRVPLGDGGGAPHALTHGASKDSAPRFGAEGLYFLSDRAEKRTQVWLLPVAGGEPIAITDEPLGVAQFELGGDTLVVLAEVIAGVPHAEQRARAKEREERGPSALHYRDMPVRHWDRWIPDTGLHAIAYRHGARVDLTPDARHELRNQPQDPALDVSADGTRVAVAWATPAADRNFDSRVRVFDLDRGQTIELAADANHLIGELRLSPDGSRVAMTRAVRRTGKADLTRLWIGELDARRVAPVNDWDAVPHLYAWSRDGASLIVTADDDGRVPVYRVDAARGDVTRLTTEGCHGHLRELPDGRIAGVRHRITHPPEPFVGDRLLANLSGFTEADGRAIAEVSYRDTPGDGGTPIGWFFVRPAHAQKSPALLWIHGGPIGQHHDGWHWRWNPLVAAAHGYAVALPNPRGSTGRGQAFMDGVQGNAWGDACYRDLMAVTDALARDPHVDGARLAAMGGSFGGYMANWIGTQTDRFAAIVTHASIYHLVAFHGATDYPAWFALEMGLTPYTDPIAFDRFSPHAHVAKWKTPVLVLHGEKDYRVPISDGLLLFEALRHHGVDAELVVFPDENHWILKPRNIRAWYAAWIDFVGRHL